MILQCLEVTSHFDCVVLTAVNKETQFRIIFLMKSNVQQIKCFILTSVCKQEDAASSSCNLGQMSQCVKKKSSAKFPLIENYPAGSGTIASPALIFSKEVPTTRCRFFFQCLFQKIKVENKFNRDKVQMVKRAKPWRRLSLVFISLGGDLGRQVAKRQNFRDRIVATTRLSSLTLQSVTTSTWTVF